MQTDYRHINPELSRLKLWAIRHGLWECAHDDVWLHDTPEKMARFEQDVDAWFEDYPFTDFPQTYRCKICERVR